MRTSEGTAGGAEGTVRERLCCGSKCGVLGSKCSPVVEGCSVTEQGCEMRSERWTGARSCGVL